MTDFPFPYYGDLDAPVYMILDPVVGNTGAKSPMNKQQAEWMISRLSKYGKFTKEQVCFISAAPPVSGETWQSGKLIGAHMKEHRDTVVSLIQRNKPKMILAFGAKACQQVFGRAVQITKVRGQAVEDVVICPGTPVLPMLSPFFAQRQPDTEATFNADLQTAARIAKAGFDVGGSVLQYAKDYKWCYDLDFLIKMRPKRLSVDVETRGLVPFAKTTALLTVQLTWAPGKSVIVPINYDYRTLRHHNFIPWDTIDRKKLFGQIKTLLEDPRIAKFGHNFKFDVQMLFHKMKIDLQNYADDTMLMAHLLDENIKHNVDDLVRLHVPEMAGFNDVHNNDPEHHGKTRMDLFTPEKMCDYGCGDTDAAWRLYDRLLTALEDDQRLLNCYKRVTMPAQRAFCDIERNGFPVDPEALQAFQDSLRILQKQERHVILNAIPKTIRDKWRNSGVGLKATRADLLRDWIYTHPDGLQLEPVVRTKSGLPSISSKQALPFYVADYPILARLTEYIKNDKMLNTYAKGFWKYIFDDKIRPTYKLAATVTGRSACFVAGTQVYVLDGRRSVSIENIKPGDWVWGFDSDGKPTPTKVSKACKTKTVTKLAKVVYRTQGARATKVLKCTPDHRFRLRDGTYREAQHLQPGDRLMSLEREVNSAGYARCYATGNETFLEHRHVAGKFGDIEGMHVHHKDERKLNNAPDNLEIVTPTEHMSKHPWTATKRRKLSNTLWRHPHRKGGVRGSRYEIYPDEIINGLDQHDFSLAKWCRANSRDYTIVAGKLRELGHDPATIGAIAKAAYQQKVLPDARMCVRLHDAARILRTNFYEARKLLASDNNHEVFSVELVDVEPTPVYDITTPETSCFVANGVCVHNSDNPNGQNFPKRGKMAKKYRKIFKAPKGWVFISLDLSQAELRIAACMSGDRNMINVYRSGGDIHRMTAAGTMGLTLEQFLKLDKEIQALKRFQAKAVNFGFLYGMWWKKFRTYAKTDYGIDFTEEEAQHIREMFFQTYPALLQWHQDVQEIVQRQGYIRTFDGRIRHLPNVNSRDEGIAKQALRQAINSPVQSIASDIGLMTLGRLVPYLKEQGIDWLKPCGFIHDAIVCMVREEHVAAGCTIVKQFMENNPFEEWFDWVPDVPIVADAEIGRTLAETYELSADLFEGKANQRKSYTDLLADLRNDLVRARMKATDEKDQKKLDGAIAAIEADAAQSGVIRFPSAVKSFTVKPKPGAKHAAKTQTSARAQSRGKSIPRRIRKAA
ncbi:DNA polymerase [Rhodobacter phage RcKickapoo]|nr:DNA polymerase [Rhodobacter phage RcKickapoo]